MAPPILFPAFPPVKREPPEPTTPVVAMLKVRLALAPEIVTPRVSMEASTVTPAASEMPISVEVSVMTFRGLAIKDGGSEVI